MCFIKNRHSHNSFDQILIINLLILIRVLIVSIKKESEPEIDLVEVERVRLVILYIGGVSRNDRVLALRQLDELEQGVVEDND